MDTKEGAKMNFYGDNVHREKKVLENIVLELSGRHENRFASVLDNGQTVFVAGEAQEGRIVGVRANTSSQLQLHVQIPDPYSGILRNRFTNKAEISKHNGGCEVDLTIQEGTDDPLNLHGLGHARKIGETRKNLGERLMDVLSKPFKLFAVKK